MTRERSAEDKMRELTYTVLELVSRHQGTLPVILTCPHDGNEQPPGVPEERNGQNLPEGCQFEKDRDKETRAVTLAVAQRVFEFTGEAPYVIIAEFSRKFIDANRTPECAYEVQAAAPFYDEYHNTIRAFVDEIRRESGGLGLLFDIHGTAGVPGQPAGVYLGTDEGKTIEALRRVDPDAMSRRRSLPGLLTAAGITVLDLSTPPLPPGTSKLSGGHTVRTYGSSHADGLDAFQIEIDESIRTDPDKRAHFIEALARTVASLVTLYASAQTSAAVRELRTFGGGAAASITAQLRNNHTAGDVRLRLGGGTRSRGRIEIRHDPGGSNPSSPRRAGVLLLYDERGEAHSLWVDNQGRLRISNSDPGAGSQTGTVVGTQS